MCNRILLGHFLVLALFFIPKPARAQSASNEGTEFYAVFPTHMPGGETDMFGNVISIFPAEYSIFITGKQASSGTVTVGTSVQKFNLTQANSVYEVRVPRSDAYINGYESNTVLANRAIKILVDPGKPKVVVYGHIFAGRRSAASLILPKEALGQLYFSMNYEIGITSDPGQNHIVLAATEADTKIFLQKNGADLVPGGVLLRNAGDVYEYVSDQDLTGTKIFVDPVSSACKKFALFSGATNSGITIANCFTNPKDPRSSDPLYQQNYPVESWGKTYGFVPFSSTSRTGSRVRANGNYVRVLAKEDNTKVLYNGNEVATLMAGQYYQASAPTNEAAYITASNPIAVAQYSLSQYCAGGGYSDPDMVILNPIEYNIKNITVYSSSKENIAEQYINILIKTSAASTFKVNGVTPAEKFVPIKSAPDYSYLQLNLNSYRVNNFNLSASDGFNAIAYGFGDVESYAYSAGTNLASSQFAVAENLDTQEEIDNACSKEAFRVKVTLTSPVSGLSWQFEDGAQFEDHGTITSVPTVRSGTTYYDYYYPREVFYNTPGQKTIKVIAKYPTVGGCTLSEQQIDLIFNVYDPPEAKFKTSNSFCALGEIRFTDESIDNGNLISSWNWDFGDGNTSDEQNPVHTYSSPGIYTVKLMVKNSTSCDAVSSQQSITVNDTPVASFGFSPPDCNSRIVFTDRSTISVGSIVKWSWDFGDGSPNVDKTDNGPLNHQYSTGGIFQVSLTVTSNTGCESTVTQTLNNFIPSLEAGADVIILQGGSMKFNVTATGTNLRYKWSPSAGLDHDDVKNPVASPTVETRYTLTITSEEGCVLTDNILVKVVEKPIIRNTFTPNGDGVNDEWVIDYLESYPQVRVNIFNRFGTRIYASIGYSKPWDGMLNGTQLPVGTYYYVIDARMGLPVYKGWVTILR